jgi:hypothetical protein
MYTTPFVGWIANAAARLMGSHGAVTEQAQKTRLCKTAPEHSSTTRNHEIIRPSANRF